MTPIDDRSSSVVTAPLETQVPASGAAPEELGRRGLRVPRPPEGRLAALSDAMARRPALVNVAAICALAGVMRLLFQHALLDTDPTFALIWGRDIVHGRLPDFAFASGPTAHPLPTLESALVAPLGNGGAATAMLVLSYLCLGAVLWGAFRLGEAVFSRPVGLLAMVLLGINFATVDVGLAGFLDVQYIALVIWAAVLEVQRPRRGATVLTLLVIATLLRPEGWLLAVLYWLYAYRGRRSWPAIMVVFAPAAWVIMDVIVTGHPLFALNNSKQSSEGTALATYGNQALLTFAVDQLRDAIRAPVLLGGAIGCLLALRLRFRASVVPAAILLTLLAAFFGFLVLRLPVPNRMALAPGVMLALFCSFATLGWIGHRRGTQRRLWMVGATAMAALLIATAPGEITRLHQLTQRRAAMQRIMADLNTLGKSPAAQAALASCRTLTVGAPDIVPYTAYYLDRPLQRMAALTPSNGRNGAYLALTSLRAAQFVLGPQPERGIWVPAGFKPAAGDRSWRLYTRGC